MWLARALHARTRTSTHKLRKPQGRHATESGAAACRGRPRPAHLQQEALALQGRSRNEVPHVGGRSLQQHGTASQGSLDFLPVLSSRGLLMVPLCMHYQKQESRATIFTRGQALVADTSPKKSLHTAATGRCQLSSRAAQHDGCISTAGAQRRCAVVHRAARAARAALEQPAAHPLHRTGCRAERMRPPTHLHHNLGRPSKQELKQWPRHSKSGLCHVARSQLLAHSRVLPAAPAVLPMRPRRPPASTATHLHAPPGAVCVAEEACGCS